MRCYFGISYYWSTVHICHIFLSAMNWSLFIICFYSIEKKIFYWRQSAQASRNVEKTNSVLFRAAHSLESNVWDSPAHGVTANNIYLIGSEHYAIFNQQLLKTKLLTRNSYASVHIDVFHEFLKQRKIYVGRAISIILLLFSFVWNIDHFISVKKNTLWNKIFQTNCFQQKFVFTIKQLIYERTYIFHHIM